jgi:hypothetical protein
MKRWAVMIVIGAFFGCAPEARDESGAVERSPAAPADTAQMSDSARLRGDTMMARDTVRN